MIQTIIRPAFSALLLFLFCLQNFMLSAQTDLAPATLDWGNEYPEPANTMATKIIGITPEGFYVLRQKILQTPNAKPRAWVEFFSKDMKLQRSEEVDLKYKSKQRDFENVVLLNNKLYLLTSFNNTAKKQNFLFKQDLNPKTLVPDKDLDMICETEARNKDVEGSFGFQISKDSSKLLVFNDLPYEKNQPERYGFRVFDHNSEPLWAKNIILPYPDNKFTVEEYRVDNEGNVFLLGVLYEDGAKYRRLGNPTYQYVILSYTESGEKADEFRIDLQDKFITDLTFRIGNDGHLICCGFYSEKNTYSVKGAYYMRLDPKTRAVSERNYQPFDFEFLTEFMSDKSKQKAKEAEANGNARRSAELYNFSLDELILRSDGGAVLVAEQYYVEQETYRDYYGGYGGYYGFSSPYSYYNRQAQTDYYYNYNDIIVVNIRPTGEIEWTARIPKRQESRNDGGYYLSYSMATVRDKLCFVYNDNARNFDADRKENRIYSYNGSESIIALAEVNIKGEVATYPLASNRDAGVITRPKMCKQIGRREMAVFGERGRGYRFANLKFE